MNFKISLSAIALLIAMTVAPHTSYANDGNFMIRILGTGVLPDADASVTTFPAGTPVAGADSDVSDEFIPATTLTYFLNNNLAVELFCCFAKHQAEGTGTLNGLELADFWIFPPSLTLQYHFNTSHGIKPYVGVGLTYINFFDEEVDDLANTTVEIDDAFGFALQAGVDVSLGRGWYFNADVKKVWIDTEVHWRGGTNLDADLDVDPLIVSAGLGYRFDIGDLFGRRAAPPLK